MLTLNIPPAIFPFISMWPPGPKKDGKRRLSRADRRRMVSEKALASLDDWRNA